MCVRVYDVRFCLLDHRFNFFVCYKSRLVISPASYKVLYLRVVRIFGLECLGSAVPYIFYFKEGGWLLARPVIKCSICGSSQVYRFLERVQRKGGGK